jgi:hypothetical protein
MLNPPSADGFDQPISNPLWANTVETDRGVPGSDPGDPVTEFESELTPPPEFFALTEIVYVLPFVSPVSRYVNDPAEIGTTPLDEFSLSSSEDSPWGAE